MRTAPATSATATTATLVRKIEPHQKCCSSQPLVTPPRPAPTPANPAQMAIARRRSSGGKTWASTDSVAGMTSAAPTPMRARAAISWPDELANAATPDAPPKSTRPPFSARRRPYRSPSAPAVRRSPANTRLYASTIHCSALELACRSFTRVGRATFSDALATTIITRLRHSTPRVHQRRSYSRAISGTVRSSCSTYIERSQRSTDVELFRSSRLH